jgi:hypothetical protein
MRETNSKKEWLWYITQIMLLMALFVVVIKTIMAL